MNNNTNCKNRREAIMALVLDELAVGATDELRKHIQKCRTCRELYQVLADEEQMIRSAFDQIDETTEAMERNLIEQCEEHLVRNPISLNSLLARIKTGRSIAKIAAMIMIGIVFLGGATFWPNGNGKDDKWWLGPPAAWGQEILAELENVEALVYRQRALRVRDYGPDSMGGLWEKRYAAEDKYRKDVYDEVGHITITQWTVPHGEGFTKYKVWHEHQCYTQEPEKCPPFYDNVMGSLRRYVGFLDKANRILGTETFEGRKCIGFEISPGKYGDFTVTQVTRIWFDVKTKLPVRTERHGITTGYDPGKKLTLIHDQFDYYAKVPSDMFIPQIPEKFVNADPDEVIAAGKGEMVFANVPKELRDEILAALKTVETATYLKHSEITIEGDLTVYPSTNLYLSRHGWREDIYGWRDKLRKIEWYVVEKEDRQVASFDFNDNNFRLIQTIVDFEDNNYSVATYKEDSPHRHPMDRILFLAGIVDQADYILQNTDIEGVECFGFEISAKKYGDNPDTSKHRLWFDAQTKLPVWMEHEWWQNDGTKKSVRVLDQFEWNPQLTEDTFVPKIPAGFVMIEPNDK